MNPLFALNLGVAFSIEVSNSASNSKPYAIPRCTANSIRRQKWSTSIKTARKQLTTSSVTYSEYERFHVMSVQHWGSHGKQSSKFSARESIEIILSFGMKSKFLQRSTVMPSHVSGLTGDHCDFSELKTRPASDKVLRTKKEFSFAWSYEDSIQCLFHHLKYSG